MTDGKPKSTRRYKTLLCILLLVQLSGVSVDASAQVTGTILVQNLYFPKPGKEEEVYQWRLHASDVRAKLGLPKGRVLKKLSGTGGPYVIWECEYSSLEAREKDVTILDKSDEFKQVQAHMSTLLDKFERSVFTIHN